jgi:EAL domain-containing protein (putative c-di-GMP-specific phosphodiesterase class I)
MRKGWPDFSFAFQPIVNVHSRTIVSYEALVRGREQQTALQILQSVSDADRYHFDETLRQHAIQLASRLNIGCNINLNLLPQALDVSDSAVYSTLAMAEKQGIPNSRITLEIVESEIINNLDCFIKSINVFRSLGVNISIDDFGAGYSGLNLLASFQPDSIKIDMSLIRGIDSIGPKQAIVRGIIRTCMDLGIDILAEGVETEAEYSWCRDEGIVIYQGFYFAKPEFEMLPSAIFPGW